MSAELDHVLWVGGGQGAAKTTAARTLAHRHGLRLYHVDAHGFAHVERAETGPYPGLQAFAAVTMEERWLDPEPEEMVDQFVATSRERFTMIREDLRALPRSPGILVEGPQLLPELVAPVLPRRDAAVWLVPTERLQVDLLTVRPSAAPSYTSDAERSREKMTRRNVLIAAALREEALARGLAVVDVDRYADAVDEVERRLGPLARRVGVADPATVHELRRAENLAALDQVRRYFASAEAPRVARPPPFPFACECSLLGCVERVELELGAFERMVAAEPLLVRGHEV